MARGRQKKGFRKILFWSIASAIPLFILAPIMIIAYISDSHALVVDVATIDTKIAIKAKNVAKQLYRDLMNGNSNRSSQSRTASSESL